MPGNINSVRTTPQRTGHGQINYRIIDCDWPASRKSHIETPHENTAVQCSQVITHAQKIQETINHHRQYPTTTVRLLLETTTGNKKLQTSEIPYRLLVRCLIPFIRGVPYGGPPHGKGCQTKCIVAAMVKLSKENFERSAGRRCSYPEIDN